MAKFRMKNTADIRRALQKTAEMVSNGELEPKEANTIIYACQTALSVKKVEIAVQESNRHVSDLDEMLGLDRIIES